MKTTIIAITLALTVPATAQEFFTLTPMPTMGAPMPVTLPIVNVDKKKLGTVTFSGGRAYLRDAKGVLIGTVVKEQDGTKLYDPSGKIMSKDHDLFREYDKTQP